MKKTKTIFKIIYGVLITVLLVVTTTVVISYLGIPNGFKLFTVQSGSMEPKIHTGSVVFVKPVDNYIKGDIITFSDGQKQTPTTHRIQEIKNKDGQDIYITKGDANNTPDEGSVSKTMVFGKVFFSIPFIGYPISFARTQTGLIILIIVPTTLLVYSEFLSIKNEIVRLIKKKKDEKTST